MKIFKGTPVSPGVAEGSVYLYQAFACDVYETYVQAGGEEDALKSYEQAVRAADDELLRLAASFSADHADKAKIFEAHREILADEEIGEEIRSAILDERQAADFAVNRVYTEFAQLLSKVTDELIAARATDIRDVRNRLIRILHGEMEKNLSALHAPVVVVAHDLLPSDTATLDRKNVLAIVTEVGGTTSHSAILARSFGIPAVLGGPDVTEAFRDGACAAVDAMSGEVYLEPDDAVRQSICRKREAFLKDRLDAARYLLDGAQLRDGTHVDVGLNIGSGAETDAIRYCDFIGLFRTEFLYMQTDRLPDEEAQFAAYRDVLQRAEGKPVTIRTLDIGGDKTLPGLSLPKEENPFLGCRALRLCLRNRDLFLTQLRAILRASVYGQFWIMFPMVGSLDDLRAAKEALAEAMRMLDQRGIPYDKNMKTGVMIEIPSAAFMAAEIAAECDFASVGTNDLCQYLHAADRMNPDVKSYYQSFSPAMFRALNMIFKAFHAAGKSVSVCGELAGDPAAAPVLAGRGLRKFSMNAGAVAGVKRALRQISLAEAQALAGQVCRMDTERAVKALLKCDASA
jgi:phosphotransferase system enzyme I (PtsI)